MLLFIDACVRKESRTRMIAEAFLKKLNVPYETLRLADENLLPLDEERLNKRTACVEKGDFSDPSFDYAKRFAAADEIVIAAPFWDMSYPALLKIYLENIYVIGITSRYTENGPEGLCRAKKLHFITTAGGPLVPDFGYEHIKTLATLCFGIPEVDLIRAEMLDVYGYDADEIIKKAIGSL